MNVPGISLIVKRIEARGKLLTLSISGSTAYGLATEDSDIDLLGVYQAPTAQFFHVIGKPEETIHNANMACSSCGGDGRSIASPLRDCNHCFGTGVISDHTVHEVGKFCRLAAAANPTVLELLFLDSVEKSDEWDLIIQNRDAFISTAVRRTYGGYAKQQLHKKELREKQGMEGYSPKTRYRDEKHTRHIVRLFLQMREILETGAINPMLSDEDKALCLDAQSWDSKQLKSWMDQQTLESLEINNSIPPEPDYDKINRLILELRGF